MLDKKRVVLFGVFLGVLLVINLVSAVECGDIIIEDTFLIEDVLNCEGDGLIIGSNDITLDCQNHVISGNNSKGKYGIYISYQHDITIKNCIVNGFNMGIMLYNQADNNLIINNEAYDNGHGIYVYYSEHNNLTQNSFHDNTWNGITLLSSFNNVVGNNADYNNFYGILVGRSNNIIMKNSVDSNKWAGFMVQTDVSNTTLSENLAFDNLYGFWVYDNSNNNLIKNLAWGNKYGVLLYNSHNNSIILNILFNNKIGVMLYNSDYGLFYNNNFSTNDWFNAYQNYASSRNVWNITNFGNYWSDFEWNPGYPDYYEVGGETTSIDWHPLSSIDEDNDGIPNSEDKCPNTEEEQIIYGCSCKQILELKPGKNNDGLKNECSKGTIDVFTKKIGWAKNY